MLKKENILEILANHDIMGIIFNDIKNTDEYSPEAEEIYAILPSCKSIHDLEMAIQSIFKQKFGNRVLEERMKLSNISKDIWDKRHKTI